MTTPSPDAAGGCWAIATAAPVANERESVNRQKPGRCVGFMARA
jgi:hypothetical protein